MYPVLKDCSAEDYKDFLQDIKRAIMATDLGVYFRTRAKLVYAINEFDEFVFENPMHRGLLKEIMMTSSDLSGLCKPFPISRKICDDIYSKNAFFVGHF